MRTRTSICLREKTRPLPHNKSATIVSFLSQYASRLIQRDDVMHNIHSNANYSLISCYIINEHFKKCQLNYAIFSTNFIQRAICIFQHYIMVPKVIKSVFFSHIPDIQDHLHNFYSDEFPIFLLHRT